MLRQQQRRFKTNESFALDRWIGFARKVVIRALLCAPSVFSVVENCLGKTTTEAQRTHRLHRENQTLRAKPVGSKQLALHIWDFGRVH